MRSYSLPHNWKLSRENTFVNFVDLGPFVKLLHEKGHVSFGFVAHVHTVLPMAYRPPKAGEGM